MHLIDSLICTDKLEKQIFLFVDNTLRFAFYPKDLPMVLFKASLTRTTSHIMDKHSLLQPKLFLWKQFTGISQIKTVNGSEDSLEIIISCLSGRYYNQTKEFA